MPKPNTAGRSENENQVEKQGGKRGGKQGGKQEGKQEGKRGGKEKGKQIKATKTGNEDIPGSKKGTVANHKMKEDLRKMELKERKKEKRVER